MRNPEEVHRFWEDLEEKTGEKIITYSIGETLSAFGTIPVRTVGSFFLTKSRMYFQTSPSTNWFSGLVRSIGKKKGGEENLEYNFPLNRITRTSLDLPEGFFRRLFTTPLPVMELEVLSPREEPVTLRFTLISQDRALEFLDVIQKGERE